MYVQAQAKDIREPCTQGFLNSPIASNFAGDFNQREEKMFFDRNFDIRTRLPIEIALDMLSHAMAIAYSYQNDKRHTLTVNELKMIDMFVAELEKNYTIAIYIASELRQRSKDEAEGSAKFTNPESFDYHYPE